MQADFAPFTDILTDELDQLYWEGVEVKEHSGVSFTCRAMLLSVVSDYRRMPEFSSFTHPPAHVGACYECEQGGCRMADGTKKTIYSGEQHHDALAKCRQLCIFAVIVVAHQPDI